MLSPKLQDALNAQINAEFWSAYLYLSMAMHFENEGFKGIANWFKVQFKEEQAHAEIFINYVNARAAAWFWHPSPRSPHRGPRLWTLSNAHSRTRRR